MLLESIYVDQSFLMASYTQRYLALGTVLTQEFSFDQGRTRTRYTRHTGLDLRVVQHDRCRPALSFCIFTDMPCPWDREAEARNPPQREQKEASEEKPRMRGTPAALVLTLRLSLDVKPAGLTHLTEYHFKFQPSGYFKTLGSVVVRLYEHRYHSFDPFTAGNPGGADSELADSRDTTWSTEIRSSSAQRTYGFKSLGGDVVGRGEHAGAFAASANTTPLASHE
ncbi:hypothetical protein B0H13DRAFT_2377949 [Mycena leptocephala]|nr:hypothetical protein B0H13DRAFT_2377949 [Mycena leptocephala]